MEYRCEATCKIIMVLLLLADTRSSLEEIEFLVARGSEKTQ